MSEVNNIPKHWQTKKLKNITESIQYGYTESSSKVNNGPKFLRITDIQDNKVNWDNVPYCKINDDIKNRYLLKDGDLVFARTGATVGKSYLIKGEIPEAIFASYLIRVRVNQEINEKYLSYFFYSPNYWGQITEGQVGIGQPNVNGTKLSQLEIPIPPLPEQQAIVSRIEELLSDLENGKQQLQTAQQQLKVYRQSLLKAAFEGRLTERSQVLTERSRSELSEQDSVPFGSAQGTTDSTQGTIASSLSKARNSLLSGVETNVQLATNLPKGWKWVKLSEICKIIGGVAKGKDYKGKQTIQLPYLRVANVQDGYLDLKVIKTIEALPSDLDKYRLMHGDILYTEGGDKDKLGRGTIWKNEIKDCIHQNHIFRARPLSKNINSVYIAYYSQTRSAKNYFFKHGKQTTNLASINLTILSNLPLPLCSFEEQQLIVSELESKLTVCDKIEETISQSLQQAETLRQSILKKAFEGRLV